MIRHAALPRRHASVVAAALAVALAAAACGGKREPPPEGGKVMASLEQLLDAPDSHAFSRALSLHGAVPAEAIPGLERAAVEGRPGHRVNAARALGLARDPDARRDALGRVALATSDVAVWAEAILALRLAAPGQVAEIARSRPELVREALEGEGTVLRAGITCAATTGDPTFPEIARTRLADPDPSVREAVAGALAALPTQLALEPLLRTRLHQEPRLDVAVLLAAALAGSGDSDVHDDLIRYFWDGDADRRNALADAFRDSLRPWLRDYWMGVARAGGERRHRALTILGTSGGQELLPICLAVYDGAPKRGEPGYAAASPELFECDQIVSRLAGRALSGAEAARWVRDQVDDGPHEEDRR